MAYAIATIVIMLCVIVALSINLVRERKAHMTFIHDSEYDIDAPFLPRLHLEFVAGVLGRDIDRLKEQVAVLQNRCNLLGCELKIEFFQYSMLRIEKAYMSERGPYRSFHELHRDGQRHCDALEDAKELLFKEGHHDEESWNEQIRSMLKAVKQELDINV